MPTLPTLTVTQAQADRMMAAYGTAEAYKEWLRAAIVNYVTFVEVDKARTNIKADVETSLPAPPPA